MLRKHHQRQSSYTALFYAIRQPLFHRLRYRIGWHTQAIDSAPIKVNASMDSLELKGPKESLDEHLRQVRRISAMDKQKAIRKAKNNKAAEEQQTLSGDDKSKLKSIETRQKKWSKNQDQRPGAGNKTHYSPTGHDARISVKP